MILQIKINWSLLEVVKAQLILETLINKIIKHPAFAGQTQRKYSLKNKNKTKNNSKCKNYRVRKIMTLQSLMK